MVCVLVGYQDIIGLGEEGGVIRNVISQFAHRIHLDGKALVRNGQAGVLDEGDVYRIRSRSIETLHIVDRYGHIGILPGIEAVLQVVDPLIAQFAKRIGRLGAAPAPAAVDKDILLRINGCLDGLHESIGQPVNIDGSLDMSLCVFLGRADIQQLNRLSAAQTALEFLYGQILEFCSAGK